MPGSPSFDLDNSHPPLTANALSVAVYLYVKPDVALLPNVRCLSVETKEGIDPPVARCEYVTDDSLSLNLDWPSNFEDLWPIDARGEYVVQPDDRILVVALNPDGSPWIFFDGFAQIPQVDITPGTQRVSFTAVGVAAREFDDVIINRTQRDSDKAGLEDVSGESDFQIEAPCRFNPADDSVGTSGGYQPNRTHDGLETEDEDGIPSFHVFLDPAIRRTPEERAYWNVEDAVRYTLGTENAGEVWTHYPPFESLHDILFAHRPADGLDTMDPADATTFVTDPVQVRDYNGANKSWPTIVQDLCSYIGVVLRWDTHADGFGAPYTILRFYRRDEFATPAPKLIYLPESDPTDRPAVDPATANVIGLRLARDNNSLVNSWVVETDSKQIEVAIVLVPLYKIAPGDGDAGSDGPPPTGRNRYKRSNWTTDTPTTIQRSYRWYGVDECADGHWDSGSWVTDKPFDWAKVFPDDDLTRTFVRRYRPGSGSLASKDSEGRPIKSTLWITWPSKLGVNDLPPFVNNGWPAGVTNIKAWQIHEGWKLLHDRFGIEVSIDDPNMWNTGNTLIPQTAGKIKGVEWWAKDTSNPFPADAYPLLILNTVIEADQRISAAAKKRVASPTKFARRRSADAKDHFQYCAVHSGSPYYLGGGGNGQDLLKIRDDTDSAKTHATQLRAASEFPPLAGSIQLPMLTSYYEIGDRIKIIKGRDASLVTNVGRDQGEAAVYPWIVAVSWSFENGRQTTTLQLSDQRASSMRANL